MNFTQIENKKINIAINHILQNCGNVDIKDKVLILHDKTTKSLAEKFQEECKNYTKNVIKEEVSNLDRHGQEPPYNIGELMNKSTLILSICYWSLAHSKARLNASKNGARFLSLPNYSYEFLLNPAIMADYGSIYPLAKKIETLFNQGDNINITSKKGTNINLSITNRYANCCPGFVKSNGDLGSPPDIETNISPLEEKSEGVIIIDGSITCNEIGLIEHDVSLLINKGYIQKTNCEDKDIENKLNKILCEKFSKRRILAELGIGLNPLAKLTGIMLTDEGALGTIHFGFGSNITVGGQNDVDFHLDFVLFKPTIKIDDFLIMREGELTI